MITRFIKIKKNSVLHKIRHSPGENICKPISDKGLVSGIYKEPLSSILKDNILNKKIGKIFDQNLH